MHFEFDVFVSYAHIDNTAADERHKGWVAKLHETLDRRLTQLLGKPTRIWRDPKLKGNDVFEEVLVDRVRRAAVLVSVVSPRYVRSEWTIRELNEFWKAAEQQGGVQVRDKSRIFKVLKTPVPLNQQSPALRSLLGYEFFRVDPDNGSFREFDDQFGPEYEQKFLMKLDDLAQDLKDLLECVRPGRRRDAGGCRHRGCRLPGGHHARTAGRARRDQAGPATARLHGASHTHAVADWHRGGSRGARRPGPLFHVDSPHRQSLQPHARERHDLARRDPERVGHRAGRAGRVHPPRLDCRPVCRSPIRASRRSSIACGWTRGWDQGPTCWKSPSTSYAPSSTRRSNASAPRKRHAAFAGRFRPPPRLACRSVYLIYDQRDAAAISPWADLLFDQGVDVVHPVFDGDESAVRECHEESLRSADGVVIFDAAAHPLWLRRKFSELKKIPGYGRTKPAPVVAVCLMPPKTPDKERFRSHEAMVISQWDGPSPDPWLPFIARLKA